MKTKEHARKSVRYFVESYDTINNGLNIKLKNIIRKKKIRFQNNKKIWFKKNTVLYL